ncbi:rRNA maturation RNase YbeY [Pontibacter sp. BT310]|uniref:Endoribonuclease YbeY n=1 Tax=Pontibacter populi TaxID=890055 RepID=A0ABS6X9D5_9BACT|nr:MULTISPECIES: rRNA maturation RNase YbeY [Pontibacter]MBJ6117629.1 rRNA maturation RNase YbeY [Pontibacter sp. BT310]MBR0570054.1 rRNA maturation RNase YbeY [Microvirga sp. STS03]MBW3364481.1 rRNA maturation RNase YbeY [Pontibacter populi]
MDHPIEFYSEDVEFSLSNPEQVADWIATVIDQHDVELAGLTYIFCSDDYLHQINVEYLDHDTLTDIITFDNADEEGIVESDIFVSIDRVKDNAETLGIPFQDELHRVLIHGVLHLLGYKDKTEEQEALMRKQEDSCLSLRKF